jgi:hypothetical protein
MGNRDLVFVALAAFIGGMVSAILGWIDSGEAFNVRKFGRSAIFALLSGIAFGVGYNFIGEVGIKDLFLAVLSGAGVDVLSHRAIKVTG